VSGPSIRTLLDATAPNNNSKMQDAITREAFQIGVNRLTSSTRRCSVRFLVDMRVALRSRSRPLRQTEAQWSLQQLNRIRGWSLWRVDLNDSRTSRLTRGSEDVAPNWAR